MVVIFVGRIDGPFSGELIKLRKSSALPKTAGTTMVKLSVAQNQNWRVEKASAPL
jgi:hypothetical protein